MWYVFPGMGCQWSGMGRDMMTIPTFRKSIERLSSFLQTTFDIDLIKYFSNESYAAEIDLNHRAVPITAIQVFIYIYNQYFFGM